MNTRNLTIVWFGIILILNVTKSIRSINWSYLFSDNHIDIQVSIFEDYALHVFKKFCTQ